jgi:corrinoid protein of di/trimethylamine methyltransferase
MAPDQGQDSQEFDLKALKDDELVEQMHNDLYDGMAPEIVEGTKILLDRGWAPDKVLNDALVEGMRIVGIDFRDGILFVPEVLLAANAMKAGMAILRPLLAETGAKPIGKVVIGTVKGDIHDIGKNLVAMMLEGAGFKVVNLGRDVAPEKFVAAVEEHQANIVGISALMTTTMPAMKRTIDALLKAGLRERVKVMIGGAPVSQAFADEIGADGYARDSTLAVVKAKALLGAGTRAAR